MMDKCALRIFMISSWVWKQEVWGQHRLETYPHVQTLGLLTGFENERGESGRKAKHHDGQSIDLKPNVPICLQSAQSTN